MKRSINLFLMIQFLLCSLLFSQGMASEEKCFFIKSIKQNRQYILNKLSDSLISQKELLLFYINLYKDTIVTSIEKEKYKKLKSNILSSIFYISRCISTRNNLNNLELKKHQGFTSLFIEDERLFKICLNALKDEDFMTKYQVRDFLTEHGREDCLVKYSNEIKEYYKEIEKRSRYDKLYLLLPMSQKEKKHLLETVRINALEYRARFGDKKAEKKLIEKFEEETNFKKKSALAKRLGIAGTEECAKTLVRNLYSPLSDKERFSSPNISGGYITIRVHIISALLRIHPEAEFKYDFCFVTERPTDDNRVELYGGRKKVQELFRNIVSWSEKKYNVKPIGTPPDTSEFILRKPGVVRSVTPISE